MEDVQGFIYVKEGFALERIFLVFFSCLILNMELRFSLTAIIATLRKHSSSPLLGLTFLIIYTQTHRNMEWEKNSERVHVSSECRMQRGEKLKWKKKHLH